MHSAIKVKATFPLLLALISLCLISPAIVKAQQGGAERRAGDINGTRTVELKTRKQFACGEISPERSGGFLRYEINITPNYVEHCELQKVGSRLNDCEKLNINVVTTNMHQVNTVYTDGGIVQFWFEDNAIIHSADQTGALMFLWPGTDNRYICLPFE
jgi:hypothetical protein